MDKVTQSYTEKTQSYTEKKMGLCVTLCLLCVTLCNSSCNTTMKTSAFSPQPSAILPVVHRLVTLHHGENYWFNGGAKYVMDLLGEKDYDYWFFAGLTGENFTQVFPRDGEFIGEGVTDFRLANGEKDFIPGIFGKIGYEADYVLEAELRSDPEKYLRKVVSYIDRGIPVFGNWGDWHVIVGYEDYGETFLCVTSNNDEPDRVKSRDIFNGGVFLKWVDGKAVLYASPVEKKRGVSQVEGWVFVGDKKEKKDLAQLYRDAIFALPGILTTKNDKYIFGADAFRAWADDIDGGRYEGMKPEEFQDWPQYQVYVCVLATNSGGCRGFLQKAMELNPDFAFLADVIKQYRITGLLWNAHHEAGDGFAAKYMEEHGYVPDNLEALGGGFNITLETLQDETKRNAITATIRKFADCIDEVVRILNENIMPCRNISEIKAFQADFEICVMPAARIIGKELSSPLNVSAERPNPVPEFWEKLVESDDWKTIKSLPHVVPDSSFGWTCDYVAADDTFSYICSVLTPAGTPVPDGFQFRDAPQTLVAVGKWGDEISDITERLQTMGYEPAWGDAGCGWNTELYFLAELDNPPPDGNKVGCRWLVPCKKIATP